MSFVNGRISAANLTKHVGDRRLLEDPPVPDHGNTRRHDGATREKHARPLVWAHTSAPQSQPSETGAGVGVGQAGGCYSLFAMQEVFWGQLDLLLPGSVASQCRHRL